MSYLGDFLFAPARARSPVKSLSGGEKNRLLLARLFTRAANLIIMDEPTNDLDLETLELLEEKLVDYDGTLLLVSHDRAFLDNVVTSVLVFEGEGVITEFVGGYSDWLAYSAQEKKAVDSKKKAEIITAKPKLDAPEKKKLSYKEQKELDALPDVIEQLETQQTAINEIVNAGDFYKNGQEQISRKLDEVKAIDEKLERAYQRWQDLSARSD